ncbi:c-type cytochrome [Sphingobium sp.]|uniref:c-type cytochrome n=1 Tax=Sphingobium sp. TaxID=1912891 RepID=UPI0028BD5C94|nr:c-type cytochrome [Sphingobium sp.]
MSKGSGLVLLSVLALLSACGSGRPPVEERGAERPDRDLFLAMNRMLVAHGCSNCHAADYARVGPAMRDVATVYEKATDADRQRLRDAILHGTKGRWGMAIMPAQQQVTAEQASAIVDQILTPKAVTAP